MQCPSRLPARTKPLPPPATKSAPPAKPTEELRTFRQEFLDLQKTTRALRKDLDTLQKRLDATPAKTTPAKPAEVKPAAPKPSDAKPETK